MKRTPTRQSKHIDPERDGLAITSEHLQTPKWAIDAILKCEILTRYVVDPCCGDGRMAEAARARGHLVTAFDLYDWGYDLGNSGHDFLKNEIPHHPDTTFFMNPPFSKACEFVDKAFELGARKVVCFQRAVWRESHGRREWWERRPYNRRYVCGARAERWYATIPEDQRTGGAYQPHAWYIWERGNPAGSLEGVIWPEK